MTCLRASPFALGIFSFPKLFSLHGKILKQISVCDTFSPEAMGFVFRSTGSSACILRLSIPAGPTANLSHLWLVVPLTPSEPRLSPVLPDLLWITDWFGVCKGRVCPTVRLCSLQPQCTDELQCLRYRLNLCPLGSTMSSGDLPLFKPPDAPDPTSPTFTFPPCLYANPLLVSMFTASPVVLKISSSAAPLFLSSLAVISRPPLLQIGVAPSFLGPRKVMAEDPSLLPSVLRRRRVLFSGLSCLVLLLNLSISQLCSILVSHSQISTAEESLYLSAGWISTPARIASSRESSRFLLSSSMDMEFVAEPWFVPTLLSQISTPELLKSFIHRWRKPSHTPEMPRLQLVSPNPPNLTDPRYPSCQPFSNLLHHLSPPPDVPLSTLEIESSSPEILQKSKPPLRCITPRLSAPVYLEPYSGDLIVNFKLDMGLANELLGCSLVKSPVKNSTLVHD